MVLLLAAPSVLAEEVTHSFRVAWEAKDAKRVELELPASSVVVETVADDEITVEARVELNRAGSDEWFEKVLEGISVKAIRDGSRMRLTESYEGEARSFRARRLKKEWEFVIYVPEWTSVELDMKAGEVRMSGNLENVRIHMTAGEVHLEIPREVVRTLYARARIGEVVANTGDRKERREGIFAGASQWENPDGRTDVEVKLTVGEVHVTLED